MQTTASVNDPEPAHPSQPTNVDTIAHQSEPCGVETTEDDSIKGTGVDGSGGSDTDTSRVDISDTASKDLEDSQEHARSNISKKSAIFKPVSVTKSFLAKAGTTSTPTTKLGGEKGTLFTSTKESFLSVELTKNSEWYEWNLF